MTTAFRPQASRDCRNRSERRQRLAPGRFLAIAGSFLWVACNEPAPPIGYQPVELSIDERCETGRRYADAYGFSTCVKFVGPGVEIPHDAIRAVRLEVQQGTFMGRETSVVQVYLRWTHLGGCPDGAMPTSHDTQVAVLVGDSIRGVGHRVCDRTEGWGGVFESVAAAEEVYGSVGFETRLVGSTNQHAEDLAASYWVQVCDLREFQADEEDRVDCQTRPERAEFYLRGAFGKWPNASGAAVRSPQE